MSTISINALVSLLLLLPFAALGDDLSTTFDGHSKTRLLADFYPDNSLFHPLTSDRAGSLETELRLNFSASKDAWTFDGAWQLYGAWGDRVELFRNDSSGSLPGFSHLPNDDRRLINFSDTIEDDDKLAVLHRLDRLSVTYATDNLVVRAGRQAITWGNGLIFSPMDIVNPFDPTAVDTEYKSGDDMIYAQYLLANGNDIEFAQVFRRDPVTGDSDSSVNTTAIKYHRLLGDAEYDLMIADHSDNTTIAIGGNRSVGGAVVHGDVVWTDSIDGSRLQLVANVSYSWVWGGKNISGLLEYYFNEFGQRSGQYDIASLTRNPALLDRLERGEVFTVGRHYLSGGLIVEMTPLWILSQNVFANLDDSSALLQVVSRNSLSDNAEILAAINLPIGPGGSEFGGISTGITDTYLSSDLSVFAQFSFYF
ncbi:MAG: hypothetical protein P8M18_12615 [Woeseiaceae bacterium]|nr:hypothetical protein [Woeseiaceae bacterium]